MKLIFRFFKFCWNVLSFIRNFIMGILSAVFVVMVVIFFSSKDSIKLTGDQGALYLNLNGYLTDNREEGFRWQEELRRLNNQVIPDHISTFDLVYAIREAEYDSRIRGLVINLNEFVGADLPALEYIGRAIKDFKESKKPVIVYADNYSQEQYFLASFADEIYVNSIGQIDIHGLSQQSLYYKEMLDKLGVTPHVFRVGTYKSAVEPYLRNNMSPEARVNAQQWLSGMWSNYLQTVSNNRGISTQEVLPNSNKYLSDLKALNGDETAYIKKRHLITQAVTRFELDEKLASAFGRNEQGQIKLLAFDYYLASLPDRILPDKVSKNIIAVVNVEGTIIDGESNGDSVGGDTVAKLLRQAHDNEAIKAVILRVNSPGGSAFASEIIRQETENLQKAGKPVVVSMGGLAASGGYWISSTSDYIVADRNTLTGSIGIFSVFPTFEKSIKKIGLNTDGVATTDLATASLFSPLNKTIQDIYQLSIENGYQRFLSVVSRGRRMTKEKVDKIAQGRVWLGSDAYKNGLVDELGDFDDAVEKAKELINKSPNHVDDDFSVQWLVDENRGILSLLDRKFTQKGQAILSHFFSLPHGFKKVKEQLNILDKFNDPNGQYLYCLSCGNVK